MLKKGLIIFAAVLLLPLLFMGTSNFLQASDEGSFSPVSFEKSCDVDCCSSRSMACPLCMTSNSISLYLPKNTGLCMPLHSSFLILIDLNTLSDQGFVKSICHPPTSIL